MLYFSSKIKKFFIAGILVIITVACSKDSYQNFPYVPVNITLNLAGSISVLGIGSAMVCPVQGGVKGIIIYRSDVESYYAYDRLCPNYPNDTCTVIIDNSATTAHCHCCQSKFQFSTFGCTVSGGPAKFPLKQYTVTVDGNYLYITN